MMEIGRAVHVKVLVNKYGLMGLNMKVNG